MDAVSAVSSHSRRAEDAHDTDGTPDPERGHQHLERKAPGLGTRWSNSMSTRLREFREGDHRNEQSSEVRGEEA